MGLAIRRTLSCGPAPEGGPSAGGPLARLARDTTAPPLRPVTRFAVLLALALAACGNAAPAPEAVVTVRAVFVEPLFEGQAARFDHEAVPGWMDAMTMPFAVSEPSLVADLPPGTKVEIQIDTTAGANVVAVERLPAATELRLQDRTAAPADSL